MIDNTTERLVECDKFVLDRVNVKGDHSFGGDETCHILVVLNGNVEIGGEQVKQGQSVLLPARLGRLDVETTGATVLDAYLP